PACLPPPPLYSLFPYTPLFRSLRLLHEIAQSTFHRDLPCSIQRSHAARLERGVEHFLHAAHSRVACNGILGTLLACRLAARIPLDRKSTRLNSSHVKISYAVFC